MAGDQRAALRRHRPAVLVNPLRRIGPYQVERLLGFGSFATVWLGHDPSLGARVAIKVLAENWSHDLRVRERFLDEGRLLWRLDHERLVRVYSVGELDDGRPYLVMAWAEGGSLRDRLAAGPMPVAQALHVLREIAAGVGVLHASGIVHRDLTPGNVLFQPRPSTVGSDATESVLIADLGLAKAIAAASGLTARAGTPGYMAPEQESSLALVDARTDVFGLGRLGARLLGAPAGGPESSTGMSSESSAGMSSAPSADATPEVAQTPVPTATPEPVQTPEPTATPETWPVLRRGVPSGIAAVLRKASARRPDDRYSDAMAFADALDRALEGIPDVPARNRRPRRGRTLLAASVAALVVTLSAVAFTLLKIDWPDRHTDIGEDSTGRITVALPDGWRSTGSGWIGQRGPDGALEPALVLSPDPERWRTDPAVPGAFVGLSRTLAARHSPAGYVAEHPHAECDAAPVRTVRRGSIDWFVAGFTACREGKPVIVEAAGIGPDGAGLVYVQVAPPTQSTPDFVDNLLTGVRVRP